MYSPLCADIDRNGGTGPYTLRWLDTTKCSWRVQAERLDLLSTLQQLPLKVRTEEQEAILQGLSIAEMGEATENILCRPDLQHMA